MVNKKGLFKKIAMSTGMTLGLVASSLGLNKEAYAESVRPDYSPVAISQNLMNQDYSFKKSLGEIVNQDENLYNQLNNREGFSNSNNYNKTKSKNDSHILVKVGKGLAGFFTGMVIHEGSHFLAGRACGINTNYNPFRHPTMTHYDGSYSKLSSQEKVFFSGAGLIGQTLVNEILLRSNYVDKNNFFIQGLVGFGIADNLRYGLVPEARGENTGDVNSLDKNGLSSSITQPILTTIAASQAYRLAEKSDDLQNNVDVFVTPNLEGGITAGITYKW